MNATVPSIAEMVDLLFDTLRHPSGRPYMEREVGDAVDISHKTLNHIRTGRTPNPSLSTIRELCRFFDISLAYFQCTTWQECYAFLNDRQLREEPQPNNSTEIMFRALHLSEEAREDILKVMKWVEVAEQAQRAERGKYEQAQPIEGDEDRQ